MTKRIVAVGDVRTAYTRKPPDKGPVWARDGRPRHLHAAVLVDRAGGVPKKGSTRWLLDGGTGGMKTTTSLPSDTLLGIVDCARKLHLSENSVRRLSDSGRLPSVRTLGGHRLFRLSDVRAFRRMRRRRRASNKTKLAA